VHIFGFGHTQSDDVRAKKPAPVFIKNVLGLLAKKGVDVVIADKCVFLLSFCRNGKLYDSFSPFCFAVIWAREHLDARAWRRRRKKASGELAL
jgi:hypothetical protein